MKRNPIYLIFLALLFVSCEEYYNPSLEVVPELLVVESHVTNDPAQNYVKLTKTQDFYSTSPVEKIAGATVDLVEVGGTVKRPTESVTRAIENSSGYYVFPATPLSGKWYKLRIRYQNDIFESDLVLMPPQPSIDSLYTNHKIEKSFRTDAYGGPTEIEIPSREICIDAPIGPSLGYYRFSWRTILQWEYYISTPFGPPPPPIFGWISFYDNDLFNIAGSKQFSISSQIKNHPILSLAYDAKSYLDSASQVPNGWILILDQYGISSASYDFHERLNKQFLAEGSLFDPVLTQVYGNIHCNTNVSKVALGFFDLNSYRQYRYFLNFGPTEKSTVIQRRLSRYLAIPDKGFVRGLPPVFWENNY